MTKKEVHQSYKIDKAPQIKKIEAYFFVRLNEEIKNNPLRRTYIAILA